MTLDDMKLLVEQAVRRCWHPSHAADLVETDVANTMENVDYYASFCDLDPIIWNCHPPVVRAFHRTARLYVIARDQGMEAALLHQLAEGGAA